METVGILTLLLVISETVFQLVVSSDMAMIELAVELVKPRAVNTEKTLCCMTGISGKLGSAAHR